MTCRVSCADVCGHSLAPEPVPGKVKQKLQERSQQHSKDLSLHIDPTLMFTYKRKKPDTRHHSK